LVAEFLERNYDVFFEKYTQLLQSTNYVTKRQSLKVQWWYASNQAETGIASRVFCVLTLFVSVRRTELLVHFE